MATRKRTLTAADKRALERVTRLWEDYRRKNPGISQEVAAERAGFTQSAFSQFLRGRVPIRLSPTLKFARLFGVSPMEIRDDLEHLPYRDAGIGEQQEQKLRSPVRNDYLPEDALDVARVYNSLEPQTKEQFRELLFIYSAIDRHYPWLRRGRPRGESYNEYERRLEENMAVKVELLHQQQVRKQRQNEGA